MTTALGLSPDSLNTKLQMNFSCLNFSQFLRLLKKTYEIEQTDLTSSLKNGNLSLATFNGLRAQKFAKLKSRALSVILPT